MSAQPEYIAFSSLAFPRGDFATLDELYRFVIEHYDIETNVESDHFIDILDKADVIFLGETHHNADHTAWNGRLVNALWDRDTDLMIEHQPIGAGGQLVFVDPEIAETARQWDFAESETAAIFDQLVALSELIPDDFRHIEINTNKELLAKGSKLIDDYLIHMESIENAWALLDHQMARILDETKGGECRHRLMLKQAYLRVWVYAAFETLEAFLQTLEEELEERNGWMAKNIARTLHSGKKTILIAGSEHFHPMISGFKEDQVENPVLTFLNDNHRHYLILQPAHDEMLDQAKEIREEFQDVIEAATSDLEREAVRLCEYLIEHEDELATNKKMSRCLDDLKQLKEACIAIVEDVEIESHEQALKRPYMTGAICLRIDKVAKTIQIWNVIAEVALAHAEWLDESRNILGLNH